MSTWRKVHEVSIAGELRNPETWAALASGVVVILEMAGVTAHVGAEISSVITGGAALVVAAFAGGRAVSRSAASVPATSAETLKSATAEQLAAALVDKSKGAA